MNLTVHPFLDGKLPPAERELSPQKYRPFTLSGGSEVQTLLPNTSYFFADTHVL